METWMHNFMNQLNWASASTATASIGSEMHAAASAAINCRGLVARSLALQRRDRPPKPAKFQSRASARKVKRLSLELGVKSFDIVGRSWMQQIPAQKLLCSATRDTRAQRAFACPSNCRPVTRSLSEFALENAQANHAMARLITQPLQHLVRKVTPYCPSAAVRASARPF